MRATFVYTQSGGKFLASNRLSAHAFIIITAFVRIRRTDFLYLDTVCAPPLGWAIHLIPGCASLAVVGGEHGDVVEGEHLVGRETGVGPGARAVGVRCGPGGGRRPRGATRGEAEDALL